LLGLTWLIRTMLRSKMGNTMKTILICADGKTDYWIHADANSGFAAEELRRYLSRAAGTDFPADAKASGPMIVLTMEPDTDGRDRFSIRIHDRDIHITGGNVRSVLYGVYHFLETFAGVRFFAPDFEVVPNWSEIRVPSDYAFSQTADFGVRQLRPELNFGPEIVDWAAKNRFNSITADYWYWEKPEGKAVLEAAEKRGLMTDGSGHAMFFFLKATDYFEAHPEWFPEVEGKRVATRNTGDNFCYSNSAAVEQFIRNVLAYCKGFPRMKRINLWPGDGGYVCQCSECRKRPLMELYSDVIATLMTRVRETGLDLDVEQLAYNFYTPDKSLDMMRVAPRTPDIPTMFAFWGQDLMRPLAENTEPGHATVWGYIKEFCERAPGKGSIFSYHTDTYMNSNMCPIFESAVGEDFRAFKKLGIDEACLLWVPWNGENAQDMCWVAYQNGGLWGRLAMDTRFDVQAWRRSYYRAVFGEAQAAEGERLWTLLNADLGRLTALIFPFAPPRVSDAWGCAFNREVLKWELTAEYGHGGEERLRVFGEVAESLARLDARSAVLSSSGLPECERFKKYVAHCAIRTRGLSLIMEGQYAMKAGQWRKAAQLLQQALDSGMTEEVDITRRWLQVACASSSGEVTV